ncbi:unnamed protein product [Linum trigynum]|uniref:Cucumisin n=1 Tax=Linum trigynum TaxID=586398 RepID=A0AAV2FFE3_9ROSI
MWSFKFLLHILTFEIFLLSNVNLICNASTNGDRKVYIVYMGALPKNDDQYTPSSHHLSLLQEVVDDSQLGLAGLLIRSYKRSFNGFAAKLTDDEAQKISSRKDVVSVFPSKKLQLQTTRSWDFLGLPQPTMIKNPAGIANDVVVGIIDSGIWPELPSFDDRGFGPPPAKWKGVCRGGTNFTCNNKIIGARYYSSQSARDDQGHGTHTTSTAAGNVLKDVSFYGLASGVARGGLPSARIAVYQVCDDLGCSSADILAAFDDAIADGVDVISRPQSATTCSVAPWLLSVAASTIDRKFESKVVLGNRKIFTGISVNAFAGNGLESPLIHGDPSIGCPGACGNKIVICDSIEEKELAFEAGAKGVIYPYNTPDAASVVALPAAGVDFQTLDAVISYQNSTKNPVAKILKSDTVRDPGAPLVASFSSRGPNSIISGILKPDVSAPGVDILAGFSPVASLSDNPYDKRRYNFNVLSGTSMACPHVTGVVAYLKTMHPDWSPSALKSAILTTATPMHPGNVQDPTLTYVSTEFAYGSGQLNPVKATNPGLVYETSAQDDINLLCNLGYDTARIRSVTGDKNSTCLARADPAAIKDFNYPSITADVSRTRAAFQIAFLRTVTNVGTATSTYTSQILPTMGRLKIEVTPPVLSFGSLNEKKSFTVTVSGGKAPADGFLASASLIWGDGVHSVRSPIVIYT